MTNQPNRGSIFLRAEWRKLAMANYVVDPEVLKPFVPPGTELDFWNDKCYVSLVGFMFLNTSALGVKVPGHVNFEEVNLRFYVKCMAEGKWKRGVVFIKEIVPRPILTFVANTLFKEHYVTYPMLLEWRTEKDQLHVEYKWKKEKWHSLSLACLSLPEEIDVGSEAEFITEHYWGYTKTSGGKTEEYEVEHPRWRVYPVQHSSIDVDYGLVYGDSFKFLNDQQPNSVFLAEGSEIIVRKGRALSQTRK